MKKLLDVTRDSFSVPKTVLRKVDIAPKHDSLWETENLESPKLFSATLTVFSQHDDTSRSLEK